MGLWNCYALGQALLPLIGSIEEAQEALDIYTVEFAKKMDELWHQKLGLTRFDTQDAQLFERLFALMQENHVDFTLFFRRLSILQSMPLEGDQNHVNETVLRDMFIDRPAFDAWAEQYRARLRAEASVDQVRRVAMNAVNPKYVLRNYLAQVAIDKAQDRDYSEVAQLLKVLEHPFDEQREFETYAALPPDWASHLEVSCSS